MRRALILAAALAGPASAQAEPAVAAEAPVASVHFGAESTALDDKTQALLARWSEMLRADANLVVRLRAYADQMGSSAYALALSQKRLDAIRGALVSLGVPLTRIRTRILAGVGACAGDDCRKPGVEVLLGR